jgi:hypothetical protein
MTEATGMGKTTTFRLSIDRALRTHQGTGPRSEIPHYP